MCYVRLLSHPSCYVDYGQAYVLKNKAKNDEVSPHSYCYVSVTVEGVGLIIEFIEHFQIVTVSKYNIIANSDTQSAVSSPVVAWSRLSTADAPLPLGSRTVPGLSYRVLTATAHND
jgi:hypothetical protein